MSVPPPAGRTSERPLFGDQDSLEMTPAPAATPPSERSQLRHRVTTASSTPDLFEPDTSLFSRRPNPATMVDAAAQTTLSGPMTRTIDAENTLADREKYFKERIKDDIQAIHCNRSLCCGCFLGILYAAVNAAVTSGN